jgi:hypothetical protein
VTVQTFILSFSFAFAQSIAKSVSRCTAARKTFSAGSWPAIEATGKRRKEVVERFVGPAKLQRTTPRKTGKNPALSALVRIRAGAYTTGRQTPCGICHFAIALRMPPRIPRTSKAVTCAG